MPEQTMDTQDRQIIQLLAFAGREFDRVRELLINDDEPGANEVNQAASNDEGGADEGSTGGGVEADDADSGDLRERAGGALGAVLGTVGAVAQTAGRAVTGAVHPHSDNWDELGLEERIDWWVSRFGTAAAAVAAVPNLGGKLGKAVGVGSLVAVAAQVLVVNAVAREMDVDALDQRVSVAAQLAFGRDIAPEAVRTALDDPEAQPDQAPAGEDPEEKKGVLGVAGRTAALVWRVARRMWDFRSGLEKRQQGGFFAQAVSNLPLVGVVGGFFNERKGISRAADKAREAFGA